MKVLAVDLGSRRVGLAVGDVQTRVATPLGWSRQQAVLEAILERTREFEVSASWSVIR
jgi:RNase H-fold protein (predicted Holliday junction resolvase)